MTSTCHSGLQNKAAKLHHTILQTALTAGKGHVPPAFICLKFVVSLDNNGLLQFYPTQLRWSDRDWFVDGKGYGRLTPYATLSDLGYISAAELDGFAGDYSLLACHPNPRIPGVELISGSLGHGLGISSDLALSFTLNSKIMLMDDGGCYEGSASCRVALEEQSSDGIGSIINEHIAASSSGVNFVRLGLPDENPLGPSIRDWVDPRCRLGISEFESSIRNAEGRR